MMMMMRVHLLGREGVQGEVAGAVRHGEGALPGLRAARLHSVLN